MKKETIFFSVLAIVIIGLLIWKGKDIFASGSNLFSGMKNKATTTTQNKATTTTQAVTPPIGNSTQPQQQNTGTNNNAVVVAGIGAASNILSSMFDAFTGNSSVDNLALDTQPSEQPNIVDNTTVDYTTPDTINTDSFSIDATV